MYLNNKPPRKRKGAPEEPANPKQSRPDAREQPASAERTEAQPESDKESRSTPDSSATTREPVTNQDEQDRITNAGGDRPVPEK
ncbi:MAG TPA: hypothetical protein VFT90_08975 [Chryseosolibacter sp.]|nr:hypothetical protein [Chryseosolibacter sp.]